MLNKLLHLIFRFLPKECYIFNLPTNEENIWAWHRWHWQDTIFYLLKMIPFVRLRLGEMTEVSEYTLIFFLFLYHQKNKTEPRILLHLSAITCHCFKCLPPPPLFFQCTWNFLFREFHSRLKKISGNSEEQDLPCGQLLERCDHSILCPTAKCVLLNVKHFHKQLEKWSHRKSCLLPYSFLSCIGNVTLFDHVVQNINDISILDRFILLTVNMSVFLPLIFLLTSWTQK